MNNDLVKRLRREAGTLATMYEAATEIERLRRLNSELTATHNKMVVWDAKQANAVLEALLTEREWLDDMLENQTCSDLCDKTYEAQGCIAGKCARDDSLRKFRTTTASLHALKAEGSEASAWRSMPAKETPGLFPFTGARLLVAWEPFAGVAEHVELGRWRSGTGPGSGWCNTYGHSFGGSPTHYRALPSGCVLTTNASLTS